MKRRTSVKLIVAAVLGFVAKAFAGHSKKVKPQEIVQMLEEIASIGPVKIESRGAVIAIMLDGIIPSFIVTGDELEEIVPVFHASVFGPLGGQR